MVPQRLEGLSWGLGWGSTEQMQQGLLHFQRRKFYTPTNFKRPGAVQGLAERSASDGREDRQRFLHGIAQPCQ